MGRVFESRFFTPAFFILMAVSVVITYSNSLTGAFQFDDLPSIVENDSIKDPSLFFHTLTGPRGITLATFYLNHAFGGLDTTGYHAVNLIIHIMNGLLAYTVLAHAFTSCGAPLARARRLSALSTLIFLLHPIQTQAVSYIVQRMEMLSALFTLASILLLIKASRQAHAGGKAFFYGLIAAAYLLGFYSKEIAITIPAVLVLYDLFFIGKTGFFKVLKERLPLYAVLSIILAVFAVTTVTSLGGFGDVSEESAVAGIEEGQGRSSQKALEASDAKELEPEKETLSAGFTVKNISPGEYLMTELNVITYYLGLMIMPTKQMLDYDFPVSKTFFSAPQAKEGSALLYRIPAPAISLAILLFLGGLAVYISIISNRSPEPVWRMAPFAFLWYIIILSPTSSFIPILDVIYEHRVYLASLPVFAVFVIAVNSACARFSRRA